MTVATELRVFQIVVGSILVIPLTAGSIGAWGGLEGLAALFGEERNAVLAPALRNHLRAICFMFVMIAPLVVWTMRSLEARAGGFRIVLGMAFVAGFVRLVGRFVDGDPGAIATLFCALELGAMPIILMWHTRLVRLSRVDPR
jgi:hypothetical protein